MRHFVKLLVCVALLGPVGAQAQSSETIADIRQELSVLFVELQKLKRELSTTGSAGQLGSGGSLVDRVNAIESEVQRLTKKTEELEFRIDRVVTDGTNRVGDLEFRLCEMDEACDIGTLETGSTLGGVKPTTGGGGFVAPVENVDAPQLAMGEQADFERAEAALAGGQYSEAAAQFAAFQLAYPGGPLSGRAGLMRGEALEGANQQSDAARAYLETFSADPNGPEAPEALYRLGRSLGRLGQADEACVTLGQVAARYPQSSAVQSAQGEMTNLGCQ
ncbi:tol-pal system protein YbgF [Roseovarius gaetbuli]|uniref:Cell division coordinator CpoB n=1 Tax=Roseovarius gaetbuli TaxID=1356575 RepID=A0A1X7AAV5_9RHOB|nr:tol-pal system protein YbgF [Roseovarius gaetbuli]SLN74789.1 tol-pal system protein YbgF [Roseovarius gaetbuli]